VRNLLDDLCANDWPAHSLHLCQCITHARRKYVELTETFPAQVRFVLETLREVYITDARARNEGLNPDQRLQLHHGASAVAGAGAPGSCRSR
jgi:hypothetical protein